MEGRTLAYMARELGVDATSISRELKRNRRYDGRGGPAGGNGNKCARCATCALQRREGRCPEYEEERCRRTRRAPFVCNGCARRHKCPPERRAYSAKADSRLVESREGLDMTGREMASWPPRSRRAWRRADHMLALI